MSKRARGDFVVGFVWSHGNGIPVAVKRQNIIARPLRFDMVVRDTDKMAKKRRTTTALALAPRPTAPQTIIVRPASTPKKRSSSRGFAMPASLAKYNKKHKKSHRRSTAGKNASLTKVLGGIALAAGLIGLAEKSGLMAKLPDVPMIGKKGAVALGAWAVVKYGGGGEIVRDIAVAATALATYQLGKENKIDGFY